jgi:hypothetical protein
VTYVSNIYKYYIAYRLIAEEQQRRDDQKLKLKRIIGATLAPQPAR